MLAVFDLLLHTKRELSNVYCYKLFETNVMGNKVVLAFLASGSLNLKKWEENRKPSEKGCRMIDSNEVTTIHNTYDKPICTLYDISLTLILAAATL